jgi:hypothetical protein
LYTQMNRNVNTQNPAGDTILKYETRFLHRRGLKLLLLERKAATQQQPEQDARWYQTKIEKPPAPSVKKRVFQLLQTMPYYPGVFQAPSPAFKKGTSGWVHRSKTFRFSLET